MIFFKLSLHNNSELKLHQYNDREGSILSEEIICKIVADSKGDQLSQVKCESL